jgi:hypothetical protein
LDSLRQVINLHLNPIKLLCQVIKSAFIADAKDKALLIFAFFANHLSPFVAEPIYVDYDELEHQV